MAYNDSIQSLKNALNDYSAEEQKLTELYAKARNDRSERYDKEKQTLASEYDSKRSEAAADSLREERNTYNMLANRGLAFSGEAAQTRLNSSLALGKRLTQIDSDDSAAKNALASGYNDDMLKLYTQESDQKADIAKQKNDLALDIAEQELKKEIADASSVKAQSVKQSEEVKEDEDEKDKFAPPLTAKELAKQLIATATGGSTITTSSESAKVAKALESIKSSYALDDEYLNELTFTLQAHGYSEPTKNTTVKKSFFAGLMQSAKDYYKTIFDRCSEVYKAAGLSDSYTVGRASDIAQRMQLAFIYKQTSSLSQFKSVCSALGIKSSAVSSFLRGARTVSEEDQKVVNGGSK